MKLVTNHDISVLVVVSPTSTYPYLFNSFKLSFLQSGGFATSVLQLQEEYPTTSHDHPIGYPSLGWGGELVGQQSQLAAQGNYLAL